MIAKGIFWMSLCSIAYTYLLYPLILKVFVSLRPMRSTCPGPKPVPDVTLIVPAYNEDFMIREKIENSLLIDYEPSKLKIVVASDGSQDRTNQIVREFRNHGVRLLAYPRREGKVNVINKSIPQISAEIVVLSDANTMYERSAIRELVRHFSSREVGCVCGELRLVNSCHDADGDCERLYWDYERALKRMEGEIGTVLGANGAIYAIRRDLFEPLPSDTIIDDFVLSMKIAAKGYRIVYEPKAVGVEHTQSLRDEFRRRVRIGVGNFQSVKSLHSLLNPVKGFIAFSFWSHKLLRWIVPFFLVGAIVSNLFLLEAPFYKIALAGQTSFYIFALLGMVKTTKKLRFLLLDFAHYFVTLNAALFCGFLKFVAGWVSPVWTPTNRDPKAI